MPPAFSICCISQLCSAEMTLFPNQIHGMICILKLIMGISRISLILRRTPSHHPSPVSNEWMNVDALNQHLLVTGQLVATPEVPRLELFQDVLAEWIWRCVCWSEFDDFFARFFVVYFNILTKGPSYHTEWRWLVGQLCQVLFWWCLHPDELVVERTDLHLGCWPIVGVRGALARAVSPFRAAFSESLQLSHLMKISAPTGRVSVKSIGIVLVFCGFWGGFFPLDFFNISEAPQSASSQDLAVAIYENKWTHIFCVYVVALLLSFVSRGLEIWFWSRQMDPGQDSWVSNRVFWSYSTIPRAWAGDQWHLRDSFRHQIAPLSACRFGWRIQPWPEKEGRKGGREEVCVRAVAHQRPRPTPPSWKTKSISNRSFRLQHGWWPPNGSLAKSIP